MKSILYNGKLINKDLIIKDIIKDTKKDKNRVYIFVHGINEIMNTGLGKNNIIICNCIVGEFEINEKDINKKTRILNSFESWNHVDKIKKETFKYENANQIKNSIKIQINDNIIPFSYKYSFKKTGKYIIKYFFKNLLTKTVCLFADCNLLKKIDLSNFNTEKVINMNSMFNGCKLLKEINVTNINTKNVIDMCKMFYDFNSLNNVDLS